VKPLYYANVDDVLVFASELKSLLGSGLVPTDLDLDAIDAYLQLGYFPGSMTPLEHVSKLLPGHRLVVEEGRVSVSAYWEFPAPDIDTTLSEADATAGLLEELEEAVRIRLMSDVPLGAMLSGGLDSSLVVALMARNMSEPVKTFSVGFAGAGEANELDDARFVASVFGAEHHELQLSLEDETLDLPDLVWALDEPLADLSSLGFLLLSKLASEHVTVALSGQGADELFGGYRKHQAAALCRPWDRLPKGVRSAARPLLERAPSKLAQAGRTLAARTPTDRLLAMSGKLEPALRSRLATGGLLDLDGNAARRAIDERLRGVDADPLSTTLFLDAQLALVDDMLHYFDRASMAHSIEARVPFLDHHVVAYAATIPPQHKVRRLRRKHILKEAARGLVPDRIIDKPKIGFFRDSLDSWLDAQTSGAVADWLFAPNPAYAAFLNQNVVRELASDRGSLVARNRDQLLLSILMLEVWLETFLPRAVGSTSATSAAVA
jgi:asparagine synthase (glutamine-hydrolysing)